MLGPTIHDINAFERVLLRARLKPLTTTLLIVSALCFSACSSKYKVKPPTAKDTPETPSSNTAAAAPDNKPGTSTPSATTAPLTPPNNDKSAPAGSEISETSKNSPSTVGEPTATGGESKEAAKSVSTGVLKASYIPPSHALGVSSDSTGSETGLARLSSNENEANLRARITDVAYQAPKKETGPTISHIQLTFEFNGSEAFMPNGPFKLKIPHPLNKRDAVIGRVWVSTGGENPILMSYYSQCEQIPYYNDVKVEYGCSKYYIYVEYYKPYSRGTEEKIDLKNNWHLNAIDLAQFEPVHRFGFLIRQNPKEKPATVNLDFDSIVRILPGEYHAAFAVLDQRLGT